jgi:4-hydroxythreonine-4-phosphate dehydrogenase
MGDPAGIGPEVAVKALNDPGIYQRCVPLVIGDIWTLKKVLEKHAPNKSIHPIQHAEECRNSAPFLNVLDLDMPECKDVKMGEVSTVAGQAAFQAVTKMIELALAGDICRAYGNLC